MHLGIHHISKHRNYRGAPSILLTLLESFMIKRILNSVSGWFKPSPEEQANIDKISEFIKEFPSARVVGRGTIVVNPAEIRNSKKFQEDLRLASSLVRDLNSKNK